MAGSGFTLQWPSEAGRITTAYNTASGVLMIAAATGATIKAGAAGKVTQASGDSVQIASSNYTVVYGNLRNLKVQNGQEVTAGTVIGESVGPESISLMVLQALDPTAMLPSQPPQPPQPTTKKFYVIPIQNGLRVREKPVDGNVVAQVNTNDILEVIEPVDAAKAKIGVKDQWVNVRTLYGISGYSSGQFLQAYTGPIPDVNSNPITGDITGMNLDMHNPLGRPAPDRLKGIGWLRVKFNVSYNPQNNTYGNTDIQAAFNRYKPFVEPYVKAGMKVLMVFNHQLYGEGAGYNWPGMDTGKWNEFIPKFADFVKRSVALWANSGLVHAYQIWNEQDTIPPGRAAVPIAAKDYANMLTQTIRAIRTVDPKTPIITGGHVTGTGSGAAYARATLSMMPPDIRPDGIAAHPYGLGPQGHKFSNNGLLVDTIRAYGAIMPGKPIWFSEWGVLGFQGNMGVVNDVASYANGFMAIVKNQFPGQVAAAVWYAWADGMDDGYGLVDSGDKPKSGFYDKFLAL